MTLRELLVYLNENSGYEIWDGTYEETLQKAAAKTHKDILAGEIIAAIAGGVAGASADALVTRAEATTSLGPLRLRAMGDNAPVTDLRRMEATVHAIDGAFNDEALAARSS
ncbi:MAG TPA: hypothetical protein VMV40_10600 [Acidiferrobacter sp.]|nr:hypothetical protein [Acidiferrobacter sp.]